VPRESTAGASSVYSSSGLLWLFLDSNSNTTANLKAACRLRAIILQAVKGRIGKGQSVNKIQQFNTLKKYAVNRIMEVKFRIGRYSRSL
jgi:hypothetical protein